MAEASEMADSEESNDMMDNDSKPDTESPSEGEGENTVSSSDDESTLYGSKEKHMRKHKYDTYLDGRSRKAYQLQKITLDTIESTVDLEGVCTQCMPGLTQIVEGFNWLSHLGSELNKRKKRYPNPKTKDRAHYRNLVPENAWIHGNIFDPMGNYLFCYE